MTALAPPVLQAAAHPPARGYLELFGECVERTPDALAWLAPESHVRLTYRELEHLARRIKTALLDGGIAAGTPVLVLLDSGPALAASFMALSSIGAIAVVAPHTSTAFELEPLLEAALIRGVIWRGGELRADVQTAPFLTCAVAVDAGPRSLPDRIRAAAVPAEPRSDVRLDPPPPNQTISCHVTYKGTGYPLGVPHKYVDYSWVLARAMARLPEVAGGGCLSAISHVPIYGLINAVLLPLSAGGSVVQVGDVGHPEIFSVIERHDVRYVPLVPILLRLLIGRAEAIGHQHPDGGAPLAPRVRIMVGGSHAPVDLLERATATLGVRPWQGYGTTETLVITSEYGPRTSSGSLGVTDEDSARLCAVDAEGGLLPAGSFGELCAASVAMFEGYVGRPDDTRSVLHRGWFRTGDVGAVDAQGFVHFRARRLPFTKIASQMVDLEEVSRALRLHPGVIDARTAVHTDRAGLNYLIAAARLRPGVAVDERELRRFAALHLAPYKVPRRVELVAGLDDGMRA